MTADERLARLEERMVGLIDAMRQQNEMTRAALKEQGQIIKELDRKLDEVEHAISGWRYAAGAVVLLVSAVWGAGVAIWHGLKG